MHSLKRILSNTLGGGHNAVWRGSYPTIWGGVIMQSGEDIIQHPGGGHNVQSEEDLIQHSGGGGHNAVWRGSYPTLWVGGGS